MRERPAVLYISYDGMLEPLGQSQVLAYLERLATDYALHLLSFEKPADLADQSRLRAIEQRVANAGISWTRRTYHKAPTAPATAFDIAVGTVVALAIARRNRVRLIHARSYVPALMGLTVKRLTGARLLFDMRGLWADERVDGGLWPANGRLYRGTKGIEARLLCGADHIVTLTEASVPEVQRLGGAGAAATPITVISTCTDLSRFRPPARRGAHPFTLGYVGSVGTWYLLDEMLRCFVALQARLPDTRLLIVNRLEQGLIRERLAALAIEEDAVELVAAAHDEVPALIGRMDVAIAIIKPAYSKLASAPTKLGEYLGCGVPCLCNRRIGDVAGIVEGERVGVALDGFSNDEIDAAITRLVALAGEPRIAQRCRSAAERYFALDAGFEAYRGIYRSLVA